MKKIIAIILVAIMVLALAACGTPAKPAATEAPKAPESAAPSADAAKPAAVKTIVEGELHMATNAAFPPYEMIKDGGGFEGIDVEIATLIAEKLGLKLVVDDMDFTSVVPAVQTGKSDIAMAGLTITETRKENIDFTDSYATGVQVIIVKDGSDIKTVDDLANAKMIGTQAGTTGYLYCSASPEDGGYGEDKVTAFDNGAIAIQALLDGKVDCVVIDNEPAKAFVAANKGISILETEFTVEDYAIGVSKQNTELKDAINEILKELIADGTVKKIVDKYVTG
ncbi:MAG: amino acid ABC transporter substrate-binding protein [Ruminococcaceae bacterium]|nr:amino acid ABC transporter substrate-binding protein [Oscillospiraceae bacterium]